MSAARGGWPREATGANARIATPRHRAVRSAVIGPGVQDRDRHGGDRVVEQQQAVDAREAAPRCWPGSRTTHFMPSRSSEPSWASRREQGRHRVGERARRPRVDAILGGSSAPPARPRSVVSASASRSGKGRHGRDDVGRGEVAQRRQGGHRSSVGVCRACRPGLTPGATARGCRRALPPAQPRLPSPAWAEPQARLGSLRRASGTSERPTDQRHAHAPGHAGERPSLIVGP